MAKRGPKPNERPSAITWLWSELRGLLSPAQYDELRDRYSHYRRAKELEADARLSSDAAALRYRKEAERHIARSERRGEHGSD